jgi:hypothetical protein
LSAMDIRVGDVKDLRRGEKASWFFLVGGGERRPDAAASGTRRRDSV